MAIVAAIDVFAIANDSTHHAIIIGVETLRDTVRRRKGERNGADN